MKDVFQVLWTLPIGLATANMVKKSSSQTQQFVMLWVKGSRAATVSLALLSDEVMSTGIGPMASTFVLFLLEDALVPSTTVFSIHSDFSVNMPLLIS